MATGDLATLDHVKSYAGVKNDGDDELLGRLVTAASDFVKDWLGRPLLSALYTERFDGHGQDLIVMPQWPITDVTSVMIHGQSVPAAASINATGYSFDATTIWLTGYRFAMGRRNVEISWTAGYAPAAIPPAISQAVVELVTLIYRDRDRIGLVSKGLAGETTSYFQGIMTRRTAAMLQEHAKVVPC